jgi:hypothetical protein
MASSNPMRYMGNDAGTDEYGLALKTFWGNVVEAYRDETILFNDEQGVIATKNISGTNSPSSSCWQTRRMQRITFPVTY